MQGETFVLIAGGGPVGLSAAIELFWRGVPFVLVNEGVDTATHPKCNNTNARSMEHFRRLGIAGLLRVKGLPADVERASAYVTRFCGYEFGRLLRPWPQWPTPEMPATISQIVLERTLRQVAESRAAGQIHFGWKLDRFTTSEDKVVAEVVSSAGERRQSKRAICSAPTAAAAPCAARSASRCSAKTAPRRALSWAAPCSPTVSAHRN